MKNGSIQKQIRLVVMKKWIHTEANKARCDEKNGSIQKQIRLVVMKKMDPYRSK